jgi:peptide/nickel transport system substrate-binding protein
MRGTPHPGLPPQGGKEKSLASSHKTFLAMTVLVLAGCRQDPMPVPAADSPAPADGDAYVSASLGDASRLNSVLTTDSASNEIVGLVFNGLVKYDRDLKLVGELAESFEVRRGGLEIVFHLRRNILWHDGKPFTSDDVKFTYEKLVDPAVRTPYGPDYERVSRLDTPDAHTVVVTYKEPFAPALESWTRGILPRHVYGTGDFNEHPANRRPVGTGPYKFKEWVTDEKIVLEANPDYFEGRPHIDRYIFRVIPDNAVQFLELRNESVDSMGLTPDQYKAYDSFFRQYNKYRYPSFSYTYFGFNLARPLFQDPRVRRAFAHAMNKQEIIDGVLLGMGHPATGPFVPQSWAYNPDVRDFEYDPAKAKALLAEAGWKDADGDGVLEKDGRPFTFTVITNQGNKMREMSAVIIQSHLAKVGVKMDVRIIEWSSFLKNFIDKGNFDATIMAWSTGIDPDQYIIWHSSQKGPGKYNFVGYADADADLLLESGRREFDQKKRAQIYRRFHAELHQDLPYIFLYYPESLPVVHKRFVGPVEAPAGLGWNFNDWFVPRGRQKYRAAS